MSHPGQQPSSNTGHELPKDTPTPTMAPPPYTPRIGRRTTLAASGIRLTDFAQRLGMEAGASALARAISTQVLDENEPDEEDDEPSAPLCLRINTSITVNKSDNLICLSETPANHAAAIAGAITEAIQKYSSGNCGIPMIDGNGNPRPIRLEVDAGMVVEGQGNIIGTETVITEVLRQRDEARRQASLRRPRVEDEEGESSDNNKRRRSE